MSRRKIWLVRWDAAFKDPTDKELDFLEEFGETSEIDNSCMFASDGYSFTLEEALDRARQAGWAQPDFDEIARLLTFIRSQVKRHSQVNLHVA